MATGFRSVARLCYILYLRREGLPIMSTTTIRLPPDAKTIVVARVEFAPEVAIDLDRIVDHLLEHEVAEATSRIEDIIGAIDVLERNPLIGRAVGADLRELVIGQRARGYVALYRY